MTDLKVTVDDRELAASWVDENPDVRAALAEQLPVEGDAARWGDELYFEVRVDGDPEQTHEAVEMGTIAYWPSGNALCLFWGPTPASEDDEPRAASPVAVVAEIEDVSPLADLDGGASVRVAER